MAEANGNVRRQWEERTRVVLSPIAAPSILGLFGFAGATFIVAAHMAGWYGGTDSPLFLFPFAAVFGGVAQFVAGLWAYKARDGLATAMHGMWGSFWIGYGLLFFGVAAGWISAPSGTQFVEFGYWFIPLAAITFVGAIAALAESAALFLVLLTLASGSGLAAAALIGGFSGLETWAGWVFLVSAFLAFYTASALMLEETFGKVMLPVGKRGTDDSPGTVTTTPFQMASGMPGVKVGQ